MCSSGVNVDFASPEFRIYSKYSFCIPLFLWKISIQRCETHTFCNLSKYEEMSMPDLTQPLYFLLTLMLLYVIITGRYFVVSGFFYLFFYKWFKQFWHHRKLGNKDYTTKQLRREIKWSAITSTCFAFTGTVLLLLFQLGYTHIYTNISDYPVWWLPLSLFLSLLVDETYYYWVHRWMHRPKVFRRIHKIHHQSSISSPWTAFTFHPVEGLLLSLPLVITVLFIPMHFAVILVQLTIMTFTSVINHLDIEIYPKRVGKFLIGATHHSQHHKYFRYNFGLYFTFWDTLKHTDCRNRP